MFASQVLTEADDLVNADLVTGPICGIGPYPSPVYIITSKEVVKSRSKTNKKEIRKLQDTISDLKEELNRTREAFDEANKNSEMTENEEIEQLNKRIRMLQNSLVSIVSRPLTTQ